MDVESPNTITRNSDCRMAELEAAVERLRQSGKRRHARNRRGLRIAMGLCLAVVVGLPMVAHSLDSVPHTPEANQPILAEEVAANYQHLVDGITALESRVGTLEESDVQRLAAAEPSDEQMLWQSATSVRTTDANGLVTIDFATPFPNGLLNVVVADGHGAAAGITKLVAVEDGSTSSFIVSARAPDGTPIANTQLRFNWFAIGW